MNWIKHECVSSGIIYSAVYGGPYDIDIGLSSRKIILMITDKRTGRVNYSKLVKGRRSWDDVLKDAEKKFEEVRV